MTPQLFTRGGLARQGDKRCTYLERLRIAHFPSYPEDVPQSVIPTLFTRGGLVR